MVSTKEQCLPSSSSWNREKEGGSIGDEIRSRLGQFFKSTANEKVKKRGPKFGYSPFLRGSEEILLLAFD